jgi:N6-adenosine-specific RNA methylase IME4
MSFWPFDPLEVGAYDLVMVDPPWTFALYSEKGEEKSAQAQYGCMTLEQIQRLPIAGLGKPDSLCWLWATNPMLPQGIETLRAWGYRFVTAGTWAKMTKNGKQAFGTGFVFRCASEQILIGAKGKPKTTRSVRSLIMGPVREHSRKPDEAYVEAERLMPNARRADVFSRERRPGWESWGTEIEKFGVSAK